jgi:hypothetical protein
VVPSPALAPLLALTQNTLSARTHVSPSHLYIFFASTFLAFFALARFHFSFPSCIFFITPHSPSFIAPLLRELFLFGSALKVMLRQHATARQTDMGPFQVPFSFRTSTQLT